MAREKYLPVCNAEEGMSLERFQKVLQVAGIPSDEIPLISTSIDKKSCGIISLEDFLDFLGYEAEPEVLVAAEATAEAMRTDEGREALKELFDSIDKDKDGKVSSKEWGKKVGQKKEILAKYFGGATTIEIGQAFKRIDANGDGSLSWEEFVAAAEKKSASVDLASMKMVETMQSEDGRKSLREFFDCLDKDQNGKVSSKEWGHALAKQKEVMSKYFGGCTPAEIGQAFKRIDANKDGNLTWEEFVAAAELKSAQVDTGIVKMAEAMQSDESKTQLRAFFDVLDKDGNGKVSSKEWGRALGKQKEIMAKYFGGLTPAEIGQAFKLIDANKDGQLSWEEFVAAADAKSAQVSGCVDALAGVMQTDDGKAALKQFFDTLDKDGNGKVDSKEWGRQLGKQQKVMAEYFGGSTPAEIGQAFKRIDANGDGSLSWDEFVAAADLRAKKP